MQKENVNRNDNQPILELIDKLVECTGEFDQDLKKDKKDAEPDLKFQ